MLRFLTASALVAVIALPVSAATEPPKPTLFTDQARMIALEVAPGTIAKSELEKEDGIWRYSLDIKQGTQIRENGVDANSGRIVENALEDPKARD